MAQLTRLFFATLLSCLGLTSTVSADQPQIGFAHRVNDWDEIRPALSSGLNGIEIDICWGGGAFRSDDWYVSHNDSNVCANPSAEHLDEWLERLRTELRDNSTYSKRLVALWLDIKDLSDHDKLTKAVDIVHAANLPWRVNIIYDLTGINGDSKTGFRKIVSRMRSNEGISMCAGKSCKGSISSVKEIYNLYKNAGFTRGGFNSGDSVSINRDYLTEANKPEFNKLMDPYHFKFVHTWTNRYEGTMENYIDPSKSYRTSGQIVGEFGVQWDGYMRYIAGNFKDAVSGTANVRMATQSDNILGTHKETDYGRLASAFATDKCIDVIGSSTGNGQNLELRGCDGGAYQYWRVAADQTVRLSANSNKCLDPEGPSYDNGTPLQIWDCQSGYAPHAWEYRYADETLRPVNANYMCAGLTRSQTANGTTITLQPCNGNVSQKWMFLR